MKISRIINKNIFFIILLFILILIYNYINSSHKDNFINDNKYTIYVFWTGDNELTKNRLYGLEQIKKNSGCNVILITNDNLNEYILKNEPLHESYNFLSFTHRADYLRTYFMNFYGGGYCDIKPINHNWKPYFDELYNGDYWINGYKEVHDGVAVEILKDKYNELIGNGAYICKPHTPLTEEWYKNMIHLLDNKLKQLNKFPAMFPQDRAEISNGKYPLRWAEVLSEIFHPVCYKYKDKLLRNLPPPILYDYR
jgi:hypothetical protein